MVQAALTVASSASSEKSDVEGGAFASAHIDRYSQALIALVFNGLDLAHAHVDREAAARIDIRFRGVGAQLAGAGQDPVD